MRKLEGFSIIEDFLDFHSSATKGEKGEEKTKYLNFLANRKRLKTFVN